MRKVLNIATRVPDEFLFFQEWNNIFTSRTAADVNQNCSLFDPYIGLDAGYVQVSVYSKLRPLWLNAFCKVTPLIGTAPSLVITPANNLSSFEGWRFLTEDTSQAPFYQSQTFEGLYEVNGTLLSL